MKQLFLIDTDTHAIVPRVMTDEQFDIAATTSVITEIYNDAINAAAPLEPVTCETCGKDDYCDRSVSYDGFNLDIGGCDQWGPKK